MQVTTVLFSAYSRMCVLNRRAKYFQGGNYFAISISKPIRGKEWNKQHFLKNFQILEIICHLMSSKIPFRLNTQSYCSLLVTWSHTVQTFNWRGQEFSSWPKRTLNVSTQLQINKQLCIKKWTKKGHQSNLYWLAKSVIGPNLSLLVTDYIVWNCIRN